MARSLLSHVYTSTLLARFCRTYIHLYRSYRGWRDWLYLFFIRAIYCFAMFRSLASVAHIQIYLALLLLSHIYTSIPLARFCRIYIHLYRSYRRWDWLYLSFYTSNILLRDVWLDRFCRTYTHLYRSLASIAHIHILIARSLLSHAPAFFCIV